MSLSVWLSRQVAILSWGQLKLLDYAIQDGTVLLAPQRPSNILVIKELIGICLGLGIRRTAFRVCLASIAHAPLQIQSDVPGATIVSKESVNLSHVHLGPMDLCMASELVRNVLYVMEVLTVTNMDSHLLLDSVLQATFVSKELTPTLHNISSSSMVPSLLGIL